jgi:pimeloyl-ACP methyl ester carboxylesterase
MVALGSLDEQSTIAACRHLAAAVGVEPVVFEGAAHMMNLEQPAKFTAMVADFASGR